jgi:hypothetical protein
VNNSVADANTKLIVLGPVKPHAPDFNILNLPNEYFMSRNEASEYSKAMGCPVAKATLAKLYCVSSEGPPVVHFGRKVRYRVGPFRDWLLGKLSAPRRSTSDTGKSANGLAR